MSKQSDDKDITGPYILWVNYGHDGWKPQNFNTIEEALKAEKYSEWIITKRVDFKAIEI